MWIEVDVKKASKKCWRVCIFANERRREGEKVSGVASSLSFCISKQSDQVQPSNATTKAAKSDA